MNGYLELIIGPMYSGKTTMLIARAERFEMQHKRVLYIKYKGDNRYSEDSIATHGLSFKRAVAVTDLKEASSQILESDVVIIDEGQFIGNIDYVDTIANE